MGVSESITVLATATQITGGTSQATGGPPILFNVSDETVELTWSPSGDTYPLGPGEMLAVQKQAALTGTSASGTAELLVLRGIKPMGAGGVARATFDEPTGSFRITRLNPDWTQRGPIQESATGLGDGTYPVYLDMEDFARFTAKLKITAGTGTWEWRCYASTDNDGTPQGSVEYVDVTFRWFGVTVLRSSSDFTEPLEKNTPTAEKFVKLVGVRSGDVGSSGAYKVDIERAY